MKKTVSLVTVLLVIMVLFTSCQGTKLAEGFDEAKVKESAKAAITALDKKDYDAFSLLADDSIKSSLSKDVMQKAAEQVMPNAGAFNEFNEEQVIGQKDKDGNDCAVAVITAKYENQSVTYTISFNKDMKIIGFYLK